MNYFKESEKILYSKKYLENSLENLKKRKERLEAEGCPKEISAIKYDGISVKTSGNIHSTINKMAEYNQILKDIKGTELLINEIVGVVNQLQKESREVIEYWYFDRLTQDEIKDKMYFSSRTTIYKKKNKAVNEFSVLFYGGNALLNI